MDAGLEFVGQDLIDEALAGDSGLALEGGGDDIDAEVRLAAGAVAGMALVLLRFVDDLDAFRLQGGGQFAFDGSCDAHAYRPFRNAGSVT